MEENKKSTKGGARAGAGRPKGIKKPYAQIVCSVPKEYSEKLREMAEKEGLSLSKMLQKIIDEYVKNVMNNVHSLKLYCRYQIDNQTSEEQISRTVSTG